MEVLQRAETLDLIVAQFVSNDHGFHHVSGMTDYGEYVLEIDIFEERDFPWSIRAVQRSCTGNGRNSLYLRHMFFRIT